VNGYGAYYCITSSVFGANSPNAQPLESSYDYADANSTLPILVMYDTPTIALAATLAVLLAAIVVATVVVIATKYRGKKTPATEKSYTRDLSPADIGSAPKFVGAVGSDNGFQTVKS